MYTKLKELLPQQFTAKGISFMYKATDGQMKSTTVQKNKTKAKQKTKQKQNKQNTPPPQQPPPPTHTHTPKIKKKHKKRLCDCKEKITRSI